MMTWILRITGGEIEVHRNVHSYSQNGNMVNFKDTEGRIIGGFDVDKVSTFKVEYS